MPETDNRGGATATQRRRPRPYPAVVETVEPVGPSLLRILAGGAGLAGFRWPGPASHLKLFLPGPGQRNAELPPADAEGFMVSEPGRPRPTTRTFTPAAGIRPPAASTWNSCCMATARRPSGPPRPSPATRWR